MSEYHPEEYSYCNIWGSDGRTQGFTEQPPAPPFRYYNWLGAETKESKQMAKDYENYMKGWRGGRKSLQMKI